MTSPLHPYNTIERARRWYHDNAGLEGEGATGRRHLGWVLEVLYEMQNRQRFLTDGREELEMIVQNQAIIIAEKNLEIKRLSDAVRPASEQDEKG